ncbi:hypothetical protein EVG20_g6322 [Dentipellis fragilis]|uniref:Palmitoyl-protein thioesterase 1 n=1 Tax=Dentipellis fragilis TaxID=205917 RepID=A0A4Y9YLH7_9AGAM|nr:hypothetical protein EVG20_g6322 [Dentipellis fragilis]
MLLHHFSLALFLFASIIPLSTFAHPFQEQNVLSLPSKTHRPLVLWHGMGDSHSSAGMVQFQDKIKEMYPGIFIHSIYIEEASEADQRAGFYGNANDQIDLVAEQLKCINDLHDGFDALGFSQGGQFLRAYVERYNFPPVHNLITFGSQHMGVSDLPLCQPYDFLCKLARDTAKRNVYGTWAQEHLIQAQYYRDPDQLQLYLTSNHFLTSINNELLPEDPSPSQRNVTYAQNLASLNQLVLIMFGRDKTVLPKESAWFGSYAQESPDGDEKTVIPMRLQPLYVEDWIGLRTLDEKGGVVLTTCDTEHMQLPKECWEPIVKQFTLVQDLVSHNVLHHLRTTCVVCMRIQSPIRFHNALASHTRQGDAFRMDTVVDDPEFNSHVLSIRDVISSLSDNIQGNRLIWENGSKNVANRQSMLELEADLDSSVLEFKKIMNTYRSIQRLSSEILAYIFSFLDLHSGRDALNVSHVCGNWRKLALEIPSLWTHFPMDYSLRLLPAFVERSRSLPFHVSLLIGQGPQLFFPPSDPYSPLVSVVHRLKSLHIRIDETFNEQTIENTLVSLFARYTPLEDLEDVEGLEDLAVDYYGDSSTISSLIINQFHSSAGSLHKLSLRGLAPPRNFTAMVSRHLSVLVLGRISISTPHLLDVLSSTPLLDTLVLLTTTMPDEDEDDEENDKDDEDEDVLAGLVIEDEPSRTRSLVTLSHLRRVAVRNALFAPVTDPLGIFEWLDIPNRVAAHFVFNRLRSSIDNLTESEVDTAFDCDVRVHPKFFEHLTAIQLGSDPTSIEPDQLRLKAAGDNPPSLLSMPFKIDSYDSPFATGGTLFARPFVCNTQEVTHLLLTGPLTESNKCFFGYDDTQVPWKQLFGILPLLKCVIFSGLDSCDVSRALTDLHPIEGTSPCPLLEGVWVLNCNVYRSALAASLTTFARISASQGRPLRNVAVALDVKPIDEHADYIVGSNIVRGAKWWRKQFYEIGDISDVFPLCESPTAPPFDDIPELRFYNEKVDVESPIQTTAPMDAQPAISDNVLLSVRRERSPSDPEDATHHVAAKPAAKRFKAAESNDLLTPNASAAVSMPSLGPALKIKNAIESAGRLDPIGHCTTRISESEQSHANVYYRHDEVAVRLDKRMSEQEKRNEHLVAELAKIYEYGPSVNSGMLDKPFRLNITHPGCELEIGPAFHEDQWSDSNKELLKQLFEHSAVAGYGDVQTQETKVDEAVRSAREIPASGFSVEPELLEEIQMHWSRYFARLAYALNLTRSTSTAKTVTSNHIVTHQQRGWWARSLLGWATLRTIAIFKSAYTRSAHIWATGSPSIPTYRIAEDISTEEPEDVDEALVRIIGPCLSKMEAPFGLFLGRKYCMGTQQLSGTDAALLTSLNRLEGVQVYLVPIVTIFWARRVLNDYGCDELDANVYPFTMAHVEYLNSKCTKEDKTALDDLLSGLSFDWLKRMGKDVPFYYTELEDTAITWNDDRVDTENNVGNEVDAWREDSTYLSYAVVVLPVHQLAGETASSSS